MTSIGGPVFVSISVASALVTYSLIRSYFVAGLCATVAACVAFQIAASVHIGYLDPFFLFAFVIQIPAALAIAASVGALFAIVRWLRHRSSN
jgi:hypothetical protein